MLSWTGIFRSGIVPGAGVLQSSWLLGKPAVFIIGFVSQNSTQRSGTKDKSEELQFSFLFVKPLITILLTLPAATRAMRNLLSKFKEIRSSFQQLSSSKIENQKKVIVITGCDSGLGYSLSLKCHQMGLTVVSGCYNLQSEGAVMLSNNCFVYNLDVTDSKSVRSFSDKVSELTKDNGYELHAVINNAGVMIFGEFEWYTEKQINQQVEVNILGYFRMAKTFLPLLRKHKGRLINVTSHCALSNLPSLSVYGASKAAIQSWSNGLRLEQTKYGVKVISFIPGSFIAQSNIMAEQESHSEEMKRNFSLDDEKFYGEYFKDFNSYLRLVAGQKKPLASLEDKSLYKKFTEALLHENPKPTYKNESWRYFFYYNAFQIAPFWSHNYLMKKFLKFPQFKQNSN